MTRILAIKIILSIVSLILAFHFLVLIKIVPYTIAWGGRLNNDQEMYVFESVSVIINLFLAVVLLIKAAYIKPVLNERFVNTVLWLFLFIFVLNTIGNVFAKTAFERAFSFLTIALAFLLWFIVRKDRRNRN